MSSPTGQLCIFCMLNKLWGSPFPFTNSAEGPYPPRTLGLTVTTRLDTSSGLAKKLAMTAMPPSTITEWQPRSSLIRHKASSKDTRPSADGTSRIKTPRWSKALALSHLSFDPLLSEADSLLVVSIVNGFRFAVPVSACVTKADVRGVRRLESKTSGCGLGPGTNRAVNCGSSSRSVPTPILGAHLKRLQVASLSKPLLPIDDMCSTLPGIKIASCMVRNWCVSIMLSLISDSKFKSSQHYMNGTTSGSLSWEFVNSSNTTLVSFPSVHMWLWATSQTRTDYLLSKMLHHWSADVQRRWVHICSRLNLWLSSGTNQKRIHVPICIDLDYFYCSLASLCWCKNQNFSPNLWASTCLNSFADTCKKSTRYPQNILGNQDVYTFCTQDTLGIRERHIRRAPYTYHARRETKSWLQEVHHRTEAKRCLPMWNWNVGNPKKPGKPI